MLPLFGIIANTIGGFFADRAKIKQAKVEGQVRLLQSASDSITDWEQLHAKGSQTSWKDEWVLIMFSIVFIMGFIVVGTFNGPAIVAAGFAAFATAPEWFSYTFVSICLASFGIRLSGAVKGLIGK